MLHIHLFGHLRLFWQNQPHKFNVLPKTEPLLAYLLIHRFTPVPREKLAFMLWEDATESEARANLRRHLHDLKKNLPAGTNWLLTDNQTVQWNVSTPYWLDVHTFDQLSQQEPKLMEAVLLYTGNLLGDCYEDWLTPMREEWQAKYEQVLWKLIIRTRQQGDIPQAISHTQRLLAYDPWREDAVRELMMLRYELGDRPGALQQYQKFEERLEEELGVPPIPETQALYELITANKPLTGRPALAPTPAASAPPNPPLPLVQLPPLLNSFLGREKELHDLTHLLSQESSTRLLTLTGPGGSGKTRLAIETGRWLSEHQPQLFPDGIFFVTFSAVQHPDFALPTLISSLQLKNNSGEPPLQLLQNFLHTKRLLLILDNWEHLLPAASALGQLLAKASHLSLLVTSQASLRLYGEYEYPLDPLPLPDKQSSFEELAQQPTVALFVNRLKAIQPHFVLTAENAPMIAEICHCLDGLPLAIELAAARGKLFTPAAMLTQLQHRLKFLTGSTRDVATRQQTLRNMLAWSYGLLDEGEKLLFRCLSIFTGPFSYSVAEAIVGEWLKEQLEEPFLDVLSSLVDKNMVRAVPGEEPLFRLLQTVREYAAEQLTHLPLPVLHERHLDYYAQWFAQADQQWRTDQRDFWFKELTNLLADVQAMLSWALDQPRPAGVVEKATKIINVLTLYLRMMGQVSLARQWLTKALQHQSQLPVPLQIALLNQTGWINQLMGQYDLAQSYHQQALVLAETLEDTNPLISTLTFLGTMAGRMGNYQEADRLLSQCAMYQRQNEQWASLGITLNNLAITAKYLKEYERAAAILRESIALKEAEGDKMGVAYGLSNLANLAAIQENYPEAVRLHLQSIQIKIEINDPNGQIVALDQIAEVAVSQQNYQIALQLLGTVDTLRRTMATPRTRPVQEEVERHLAVLREKIPAELYAEIWHTGQTQTLPEAVQAAVNYLKKSSGA